MAVETEQTRTVADEYDLGDASRDPAVDEPTEGGTTPPGGQDAPPAAAPAEQPRNANGTFAKPEPEAPKHSRQTLRLAADLGVPQSDVDASSPEALDDLVYALNRRQRELDREHSRQEARLGSQDAPGRDPARQAAPEPAEATPDDALGIEEAQYDPGLVAVLKRQAAKIRAMEAQLQEVHGHQQQSVKQSIARQCDAAFAAHEAILGKGRGSDMRPDDPNYLRRKAVLGLVDQMPQTGTLAERIAKAVDTLYGHVAPAQGSGDRSQESGRAEEWRNGGVARPTHRGGAAEPKGERKAMATAARIMKERGMLGDDESADDAFLK